jgi:hypothetical protein
MAPERIPTSYAALEADYEIIREIGRGGTSLVYLARERATGDEVAIKLIRAKYIEDDEALARFAREARYVAEVDHPNVVPVRAVLDLGASGLAIVMSNVVGQTLKQVIRAEHPIPPARVEQMIRGVRCDFKDRTKVIGDPISRTWHTVYDKTEIACADVNTGLNQTRTFTRPDGNDCSGAQFAASCMSGLASQASITSDIDWFRRNLLNQMPVFELQSLIDTLYLYTHPSPDLTEELARVPLAANRGLCLDVPGANSANGTALQIYDCNATAAQQFTYDRVAKTIRNPAIGKCLQVRPIPFGPVFIDDPRIGVIAEISDCTDPPVARQQWTYSHETGIVRSGLGTVLDVQWGNLSSGVPVWLWDYNGGNAQLWHADRNSNVCSGQCFPQCSAGCAGAGPGTGSCIGNCMGSCVQSCMNAWP